MKLYKHQYEFVTDVDHRYIALRAGLGAGKTYAFCAKALHLAQLNCARIGDHVGIVCEPTYPLIKDVFIPTMEEVLEHAGIANYTLSKTGGTPEFTIKFPDGKCTIKMRSAENYRRLIGINAAWAGIDEMDTMDTDLQKEMWVRINARIRAKGSLKQTFVTSTPEGFTFMNHFFVEKCQQSEQHAKHVRVIQASTYDNKSLDPEYIEHNIANMTPEQVQAWVFGNVVNMRTGLVYKRFDRTLNTTSINLKWVVDQFGGQVDRRGHPVPLPELHIGMDFNVGKMAAITHVIIDGNPHAIDEIIGLDDTESMIREINIRYPQFTINVYPDSSGSNRSHTNVLADTDIAMLKNAKYKVHHKSKNPPVKDRVAAMNVMLCNSQDVRRYFINSTTCPQYVLALERQTYDDHGEPTKDGKIDHPVDAGGYFIAFKFPVTIQRTQDLRLAGMY